MKKIININFHSRVVPIEETAYDILKKYMDSLRSHFSKEEGGDEIVNDIENRFAELFSETLKKGATCITDDDVNAVITSMGRPEDFDQEEAASTGTKGNNSSQSAGFTGNSTTDEPGYNSGTAQGEGFEEKRRLYRSENDKLVAGVCGGLAAYLRLDVSVVRIIYALISLGTFGTAFLLYVILWIVLPPKSLVSTVRKKLYRNPDNRIIGGVASGLSAYFHIELWIPRLIFALPLIAGLLTAIFHNRWFGFDDSPVFFTGGFGGSLLVVYVILWIILPEANTPSEKLEMRGEKVDLESIKNTFRNDMVGFRERAAKAGAEAKEKAKIWSEDVRDRSKMATAEGGAVRTAGRGVWHAIGILFRAFFLLIAISCTFALIALLIGLMFGGATILPLKHFIFHGFWQNTFAWVAVVLVLVLPVIGLMTFLIRRIFGIRRKANYLGYTFGSLWIVGLICLFALLGSVFSDFRTRSGVTDSINLQTPSRGHMIVRMADQHVIASDPDWMGIDWDHDAPYFQLSEDSITLSTVRIDLVPSKDSSWHLTREKLSRGSNANVARSLAEQIRFDPEQHDSILYLPAGFAIHPDASFRNQQVMLHIEIPVGQKVRMDGSLDDYHWFSVNNRWRRRNGDDVQFGYNPSSPNWTAGYEYQMTGHGLEKIGGAPAFRSPDNDDARDSDDKDDDDNSDMKQKSEEDRRRQDEKERQQKEATDTPGTYRYHQKKSTTKAAAAAPAAAGENEFLSALEALTKWA